MHTLFDFCFLNACQYEIVKMFVIMWVPIFDKHYNVCNFLGLSSIFGLSGFSIPIVNN